MHIAGSVLHEGPPFGTAVRKRAAACALCWPLGIVAFFWAAVLCGASVTEQGWATLHFAALMSSFVVSFPSHVQHSFCRCVSARAVQERTEC